MGTPGGPGRVAAGQPVAEPVVVALSIATPLRQQARISAAGHAILWTLGALCVFLVGLGLTFALDDSVDVRTRNIERYNAKVEEWRPFILEQKHSNPDLTLKSTLQCLGDSGEYIDKEVQHEDLVLETSDTDVVWDDGGGRQSVWPYPLTPQNKWNASVDWQGVPSAGQSQTPLCRIVDSVQYQFTGQSSPQDLATIVTPLFETRAVGSGDVRGVCKHHHGVLSEDDGKLSRKQRKTLCHFPASIDEVCLKIRMEQNATGFPRFMLDEAAPPTEGPGSGCFYHGGEGESGAYLSRYYFDTDGIPIWNVRRPYFIDYVVRYSTDPWLAYEYVTEGTGHFGDSKALLGLWGSGMTELGIGLTCAGLVLGLLSVYYAVTALRRVREFNDDNLMTTADTYVQRSDLLVTVY